MKVCDNMLAPSLPLPSCAQAKNSGQEPPSKRDPAGMFFQGIPVWARLTACVVGGLVLAWLKLSFFTENETMTALWEETSIYLNAYHLPFGTFLAFPDAGYINFLPKLAAFLTVRTFGMIDIYPLAFKFVSFFLSALALLVFLSKRFSDLIPSVTIRLLLCLLLFFFPDHDLYASYNSAYYIVFLLSYYVLALSGTDKLEGKEFVFILLTAPAAVWSKPVFFFFGPVFLFVGALCCRRAIKTAGTDWFKIAGCAWLLILYACQLLFTLLYYPDLGPSGFAELAGHGNAWQQALVLAGRFILFCGYGLGMPLNVLLSSQFGFFLYGFLGLCLVGIFVANMRHYAQCGQVDIVLLSVALIGCCVLSIYGILQSQWLYTCTFTDALFNRPWDHRHLFPFIVFSNIQFISFAVRRGRFRIPNFSAIFLIVLTVASLSMAFPMGQGALYAYSLTWPEARTLLMEPDTVIPIPQMMPEWLPSHEVALTKPEPGKYDSRLQGMFCSPRCNWLSGVLAARTVEKNSLAPQTCDFHVSAVQPDRKIKYLLLFPQNSEQVFLPKETLLTIQQEETHTSAKLVNPGARSYYLFVFNRVVRAKDISGFRIIAPDGNPPQTEFSVCLIGYWF